MLHVFTGCSQFCKLFSKSSLLTFLVFLDLFFTEFFYRAFIYCSSVSFRVNGKSSSSVDWVYDFTLKNKLPQTSEICFVDSFMEPRMTLNSWSYLHLQSTGITNKHWLSKQFFISCQPKGTVFSPFKGKFSNLFQVLKQSFVFQSFEYSKLSLNLLCTLNPSFCLYLPTAGIIGIEGFVLARQACYLRHCFVFLIFIIYVAHADLKFTIPSPTFQVLGIGCGPLNLAFFCFWDKVSLALIS